MYTLTLDDKQQQFDNFVELLQNTYVKYKVHVIILNNDRIIYDSNNSNEFLFLCKSLTNNGSNYLGFDAIREIIRSEKENIVEIYDCYNSLLYKNYIDIEE